MKLKHSLSLLALACATAFSTSALAQATVNFEGNIVDSICTGIVAGNGGTVTITTVETSTLDTAGKTAGQVSFPVVLSGCSTGAGNYQINFSHSSALNGRLPNATGSAGNVALELLSANDSLLQFTPAVNTTRVPTSVDPGVDLAAGDTGGTATYKVRYYAIAPVTAGDVKASATMTLTFL